MAIFVVQEHQATRRHWDFRLEIGGALKSWAVPKGPSLDPSQRRLAISVPDHDLEHAGYEGIIPEGVYGAGPVLIWDRGTFEPVAEDAEAALRGGELLFRLKGRRLNGEFALVKMRGPGRERAWLLIKKRDAHARAGWETPSLLTPEAVARLRIKTPACAAAGSPPACQSRPRSAPRNRRLSSGSAVVTRMKPGPSRGSPRGLTRKPRARRPAASSPASRGAKSARKK